MDLDHEEFIEIIDFLDKNCDFFSKKVPQKSFKNIELAWIYKIAKIQNPKFFFESGVFKGRASVFLAEISKRYFKNASVFCACTGAYKEIYEIAKNYDNIVIIEKPGEEAVYDLVKYVPQGTKCVGVIDGPKFRGRFLRERMACPIIYNELLKSFDCRAIFQHDLNHVRDFNNFYGYYRNMLDRSSYNLKLLSPRRMKDYEDVDEENNVLYKCMGVIERKTI